MQNEQAKQNCRRIEEETEVPPELELLWARRKSACGSPARGRSSCWRTGLQPASGLKRQAVRGFPQRFKLLKPVQRCNVLLEGSDWGGLEGLPHALLKVSWGKRFKALQGLRR